MSAKYSFYQNVIIQCLDICGDIYSFIRFWVQTELILLRHCKIKHLKKFYFTLLFYKKEDLRTLPNHLCPPPVYLVGVSISLCSLLCRDIVLCLGLVLPMSLDNPSLFIAVSPMFLELESIYICQSIINVGHIWTTYIHRK